MGASKQNKSSKLTKRLLGQILVDGDFVLPQDVERALEQQTHTNELLGEALVRIGALEQADLNVALAIQNDLSSLEDAVKAGAGGHQLLGMLLLRARRITPEQFDLALKEQLRTGEKLGEVLIRLGLVTYTELDAALTFQRHLTSPTFKRFSLGEILVEAGYITREQLEDALANQELTDEKIGEILVEAGHIQPHHVTHALNLQQKLVTAALVATLSFASMRSSEAAQSVEPSAGSDSFTITVTAMVEPHASLKVNYQPQEVVVTSADIIKGYVEVPEVSRIEIKSNSPAGYLLSFEGLGEPFKEVQISGLGRDVQITSGSGWIARPYSRGMVTAEISYRFTLSEGAQPGTYAWPLTISVVPQ